jgi:hypothetical protein
LFRDGGLFLSQLLTKSFPASLLGGGGLSLIRGILYGGCLQQLRSTAEREGASQT